MPFCEQLLTFLIQSSFLCFFSSSITDCPFKALTYDGLIHYYGPYCKFKVVHTR